MVFRAIVVCALMAAALWPALSSAYMPPPAPCERAPMLYGPAPAPECYAPPPPPVFGCCPTLKVYPRKLVGPPPCPVIVCAPPLPPTKASYRISPTCFAPPPECQAPPCPAPPCGR